MKVMISQPMAGKTEEQIRSERENVVLQLEKSGYEVVDTIFSDRTPTGNEAVYYLSKAIEAMSKVDGVVFMPGWKKARGCVIEHDIAMQYGVFVKHL